MLQERTGIKEILVVDDEPTILLTLSHLLSNEHTRVTNCGTIEEAEEAISEQNFNLAIADIRLSGMYGVEGLQLLGFVKERRPGTHVIIMMAYGSDEMRDQAYAKGVFHYYEKPIDIADLILKIESIGIE